MAGEAVRISDEAPAAEVKPGENVASGSTPNSAVVKPPVPGSETAPKEKPAEKPAEQKPAEKKPEDNPFVPKIEEPKEAPKIDLSKAVTEFGKDGKVSEETYKAAEKQGMTRADVDTYVEGARAKVVGVANTLSDIAGSKENLKSLIEWAGANVDKASREAFNAAVDRADTTAASLMLRGIMAQYNDAVGVDGERVIGNGAARGVVPFDNWNQVSAVMQTKEYKTDPAFRAKVSQRIAASKNL